MPRCAPPLRRRRPGNRHPGLLRSAAAVAVLATAAHAGRAATTPTISLDPDGWTRPATWALLEGDGKDGPASLRVKSADEAEVAGAVATPCPIGLLNRAALTGTMRFRVPADCADWSSVSMTFFGQGDDRTYLMVLFKTPGAAAGAGALRVEGGPSSPLTLTPGSWYTMAVADAGGTLTARVWADGAAEPAEPQLRAPAPRHAVDRVGVRTYAAAVEVAALRLSGTTGAEPAMDRGPFPEPVFDAQPGYVDLYWKACELAHAHVLTQPGMPQSPYMDEAFADDTIWIWDTCFMSLYCRYAPRALPGIESLTNFYAPIHDGASTALTDGSMVVKVQHPDNPPLFAWVEWQYYQVTGDRQRLRWLLEDKKYLQKHFEWFNHLRRGQTFAWSRVPVYLNPQPLGFQWGGISSGMDNSPRFSKDIYAIDALAQQGLAALYISRLAHAIGDEALAAEYQGHYRRISDLVNGHYWDETDGLYYDLMPDGKAFHKVTTPASFWPVLAGMATQARVDRMARRVADPADLGGTVPWVSDSRSDRSFNAKTGQYWRGSVWLPTAYMGIRALTENGQGDLADRTAQAVVDHMWRTYRDYAPHTIWECYNPSRPEPAMDAGGRTRVRPDFCGWSALGPISLLIENVIGFHSIDAEHRRVEWHLHQPGRHGVRRLRFGDVTADIVADGHGHVDVTSDRPFTLVVNGMTLDVAAGTRQFDVQSPPGPGAGPATAPVDRSRR